MEDKIAILTGSRSTSGKKSDNEDYYGFLEPKEPNLLYNKGVSIIISDGVSVAGKGKEAAEITVKDFLSNYYSTLESWSVKTSCENVIKSINSKLYKKTHNISYSQEGGFLCTLTALIIKSNYAYILHVGDTRVYRFRDYKLTLLTKDHSVKVSSSSSYLERSIGLSNELEIDYSKVDIQSGDLFLLTSDGVHDFISENKLINLLSNVEDSGSESLDSICNQIIDESLNSGSKDNLTAFLALIKSLPNKRKVDYFKDINELIFPPLLNKGDVFENLVVEQILIESKNSQLYVVLDKNSNKRRILKTPSPNSIDDLDYINKFAMEEWIGSKVDNPNLIKAFPKAKNSKYLYTLMDYAKGYNLEEWLNKNNGKIEIKEVQKATKGIISGIRVLHRNEIIHQDLKPENIIITKEGGIKIIDYGSCRVASIDELLPTEDRKEEYVRGTINFSAPEYRLGIRAGEKADTFSIASIVYYLLSGGKLPYSQKWENAKSSSDFKNLQYISCCSYNPMVPQWMDKALRKSLSILPESRHDSLSEFMHDLEYPNSLFIDSDYRPLIEKNPLIFWKSTSIIMLILIIILIMLLVNK